ncbi:hypothetical protein DW272_09890 [Blautia obeum]|uniref:Uncharacterized protein n=2 Tax=Blautia obeum TaxID=40520 RepID=A0A414SDI6_9FIRM|nr:hypothetical protein DW272_09890 [Blautia obeum]SCH28934.1 Uncharacterised protein [uncultured Ruminococcus sp.]
MNVVQVDTRNVTEICGYRVLENHEDYCLVEMCDKSIKVDRNGCASEKDLCFIDKKGLPHSAGYLNKYDMCELDKLDNVLMTNLSSDKRRIVHEWIRDTFNPIKTYNVKHSTYSLKELLERKTGIYLTNNQMKDALLNMGYICQNEHKINWLVNVSEMGIKYVK